MGQIVTKDEFKNVIRHKLKEEGKTIALCHGVFDLVHPGHITHFKQAAEFADVLVVSITSAPYVRKGPGRPYFNDKERLSVLSSIDVIDYCMVSEGYTVDDVIEAVEPDFYVKGEEYSKASDDITGKISQEQELVERHGGKLVFTGGAVYSSTKLINNALSAIPDDVRNYMKDLMLRFNMRDIRSYADKAKLLKVLVIGDTIIDRYTYCKVQGLMSKNMAYSVSKKNSEDFLGGAVAVARHLSSFSPKVTLLSVIGNEKDIADRVKKDLSESMTLDIIKSKEVPTIIKERFVMDNEKRNEYDKLFSVNNIAEIPGYEEEIRNKLYREIVKIIKDFDVVFLCDFGHGMIDEDVMELIQNKAKILILNCQTNSSNRGMNIITKYKQADFFSLDQNELKLAFPGYKDSEKTKLKKLKKYLGSDGWLTRGASGAYGIDDKNIYKCPALTLDVTDTIGAGDAFYSVAGIFAAAGAPVELSTFLGNVGGALGANIVGNKEAVEAVNVLKFANTLMNI